MTEYGVHVANKFSYMSDDDDISDPEELIAKAAKAEASKLAAQKAQAAKPVVKAPVAQVQTKDLKNAGAGNKENRPVGGDHRGGRGAGRGGFDKGGRGGRGGGPRPPRTHQDGEHAPFAGGEGRGRGRGGPRGGRGGGRGRGGPPRHFDGGASPNADASFPGDDAPKENFEQHPEGERRGGGRGRGNRGGSFGGGRGRGRMHDRQSGSDKTGVRSHEKKDGHGRGNWGDTQDELAGETEPLTGDEQPQVENEEPQVPREKTEQELKYEKELEEYNRMKTLKEFKAATTKATPKFNVRKAGEGAAENFGKLVPLKKDGPDDKEEEEIIVLKKEPKKQVIDLDFKISRPSVPSFRNRDDEHHRGDRDGDREHRPFRGGRGGGGRGDHRDGRGPGGGGFRQSSGGGGGGPRGRGGRGGHSQPFNASDDAFPALGAK
ncbi:hypothetical protein WR25_13803 [Diploscapter pachys]|uniref:Hyaluronan/mRNA-binding protein domain-containing protein n=1 Tax=Diploscapter pachys TaxID=2018661 RepID=A0A2A2J2X6_9BILA|nr:hypothetical protein WR25_13803 [Diploscapter pachys]